MKGETYEEFVDKFKPKLTTDDCYTPQNIYDVVAGWVSDRYGISTETFCRPFYPNGDYVRFDYSGKVVVDNPPFSILKKIVDFYVANGIKFFLFAPALTCLYENATAICASANVTYENGAKVLTSFVTNMEENDVCAMSAPYLHEAIEAVDKENAKKGKKQVTKLALPVEVVTAARIGYMSIHGVDYKLHRSQCVRIRKLDNYQKGIFGSGYLLSERAAAERAAAERVELSDREKEIQKKLGD